MDELNQRDRRKLIGKFYSDNREKGKPFTVNHFKIMGVCAKTIYNVMNRVDEGQPMERKPGSGRKPVKMPKKGIKKLVSRFNNKKGVSQRKEARKYNISQPYVCKILKKEGINYYKREKAPKSSEKQEIVQKERLSKLRRTSHFKPSETTEIINDDESYFSLSGHNYPGNDGFYTSDKRNTPNDIKYRFTEKFPARLLVWIAISKKGYSQPFFAVKNCAINSNIYSNDCIEKKLLPFIKKYHSDGNYIFWCDLASAHYANSTLQTFERLNIKYVTKRINPPNVPQLRPIETFWANLKAKVYSNDWQAKDFDSLKNRIKSKLKEFPPEYFEGLFSNIKTKVRCAADKGPLSVLN